ncbi:MAG: hypothetical protein AVDCRST_MAG64-958 [uncultured Phycisphaerae bacterium]|uniref:N-acetylmuramoyl-L-alanine amidase n=1 Tax=uncultured Phycisphaerae bacterium TaxID=904963 RepID=A0A6J4NJR7_9BACT|nr:MAG: hypothetical protein AVDCRST_MAG64-958 [uncultured Phycisphaerae bacterium]
MAMSLRRLPLKSACVLALALAAGCSAERPAQMVDALPTPHFNGPSLTPVPDPEPVKPAPVAPKVAAVKPQPLPPAVVARPQPASAGVPREWVPAVAANKWKWIVVHHSATPVGGAARFNKEHQAKGWDELGYHFVIGNGTDTGNGAIEVGNRWARQKHGAHCKTPDNRYNEEGIGICLVGNFDQTRPSDAQLKALAKLVGHLERAYNIPADRVIGHGDAKATECPGRNLRIATVRRLSAQALADAGEPVPAARTASARAGTELMYEPRRTR